MHAPYKMVLVNIIASLSLFFSLFFYQYVFPKKKISLFILLILISLLPLISLLRVGVYESGDFTIHIYRSMAFYDSLAEGNIMPTWAKDLNATYGYPLFAFNYTLPYYIISLLHFLGFTFITSMKLFIATTYILSGIFFYFFIKAETKKELAAFTGAIFYLFTPYHLIDMHFKVVVGELLAFTFIPLVFLFIKKLREKKKPVFFFLATLSLAMCILSHIVIGFFTTVLLFIYIIMTFRKTSRRFFLLSLLIFPLSAICSVHNLLTPFFLSSYTFMLKVAVQIPHFPTIPELLFAPWRLGLLFQGPHGEISYLIGYTQILIVGLAIGMLQFKKVKKPYVSPVLFWTLSVVIIIFFISTYSQFLWHLVPFLEVTGSHRFLVLLTFCIAVLASYIVLIFPKKKKAIYLLIFITIFSTILNWGQRTVIPSVTDETLRKNLWQSTSHGEAHFYANSKWVDVKNPWFMSRPQKSIDIKRGQGIIKEISRTSTNHTYLIDAATPLVLQENTLYFPGWSGTTNGKQIQLSPSEKGIIQFELPVGRQTVVLNYHDLPILALFMTISLFGISSILLYFLFEALRYAFRKQTYEKT